MSVHFPASEGDMAPVCGEVSVWGVILNRNMVEVQSPPVSFYVIESLSRSSLESSLELNSRCQHYKAT